MKNNVRRLASLLMPILLLQLLGDCSDTGTGVDPTVLRISGSWVWVRSSGGFGETLVPAPAGTVVIDTYTTGGILTRTRNDTLVVNGAYSISEQELGPKMILTNSSELFPRQPMLLQEWVHIEGDTLRLYDDAADGYLNVFSRAP